MSFPLTDKSDLNGLADHVEPGMTVAVPADYAGVSMAMTWALVQREIRDLHIVCVPTGGLQVDILIGAGLVRSIETSAVSLGETGNAPCFIRAVKAGQVAIKDATCPAIHAGLVAAQKGSPFMPLRGILETDVLKFRSDWKVIDNPFAHGGDPIVLIPAIHPDVAIFHAPIADRFGNVWIGRRRELAPMAYAAAKTLVTVERLVDRNLLESEADAAGTLPALYVTGVAVAPKGAWPYGLWGEYPPDDAELTRYAQAAKTSDGFDRYVAETLRKVGPQ